VQGSNLDDLTFQAGMNPQPNTPTAPSADNPSQPNDLNSRPAKRLKMEHSEQAAKDGLLVKDYRDIKGAAPIKPE